MRNGRNGPLGGLLLGLLVTSSLSAATQVAAAAGSATLRGTVTDDAGRPIRGAVVRASAAGKTIARYTDQDGRYRIPGLEVGRYELSIDAYGFALDKQTRDTADATDGLVNCRRRTT